MNYSILLCIWSLFLSKIYDQKPNNANILKNIDTHKEKNKSFITKLFLQSFTYDIYSLSFLKSSYGFLYLFWIFIFFSNILPNSRIYYLLWLPTELNKRIYFVFKLVLIKNDKNMDKERYAIFMILSIHMKLNKKKIVNLNRQCIVLNIQQKFVLKFLKKL